MTNQPESESKKTVESEETYYQGIKEELVKWRNSLATNYGITINYARLADRMLEYGVVTSDQKLRLMFNLDDNRKVQLAEMMALCEIFHLPIYDICAFPVQPESTSDMTQEPTPWLKKAGETTAIPSNSSSGVSPLADPHYYGTYYCYYFKTKKIDPISLGGDSAISQLELKETELNITEDGTACYATMTDAQNFKMKGRVFLIKRSRQICTRLLDSNGMRMINLLFSYRNYSVDKMIYRTAGMLTVSYNDNEAPLFQKMAMFRVKQDLSNPNTELMIRGVLALDSQDILIEKKRFDKLVEEDESFGMIKPIIKNYCVFREIDFSLSDLPWNYEERVQKLLKLRGISDLAPHDIVSDSEAVSHFFVNLQRPYLQEEPVDKGTAPV